MTGNKNINSEEMDNLMKQAFLNLDMDDSKNKQILQAMTATALGIDKPMPQNPTNFLKKIPGSFKIVLAVSAVSAVTVGTWFYLKNPSLKPANNTALVPLVNKQDSAIKQAEPVKATKDKQPITQNTVVVVKPVGTITSTGELKPTPDTTPAQSIPVYVEPVVNNTVSKPVTKKAPEDTAYRFPVLTDKEVAANNKQKKAMFEEVIKLKSNKFPYVPMGSFNYNGVMISVMAVSMQNTVVSNLEYRTFLSDLLIQSRKSDFLIAKVDQKQWTNVPGLVYGEYMKENYFSNTAYNMYPVVNVSRRGAEMYCKWLNDGANAMLKEKNKTMRIIVRIPTDAEWYYAASGCDKDTVYPWPSSSINSSYKPSGKDKGTNKKGCFLANFCLKKYTESLDNMSPCSDHPYKNAYTTAGYLIGENVYLAPIMSYNANRLGLYCMSGNAAEMVTVETGADKNKPGTKGGSWGSDAEHLKLKGPDEYRGQTGPSPFIGFRPVITFSKQ